MADSSFAEFDLLSGLNAGDYLVGYRNIRETRIEITDLINNTLATSLSTMSDMAKSNSVYSSVNANSSNWDSNYAYVNANSPSWNNTTSTVNANSPAWNSDYSTTNTNSAFWSNYVNYLSTTNVKLSSVTVADGLSALSMATDSLSSRRITLLHTPENDGTNPNLLLGENNINTGLSGFNIFYDESLNRLTITSTFSGVSGAILSIDRNGNFFGPVFPYTVTFTPFFSAVGTLAAFYPATLSGVIPRSEITSRVREGKGSIRGTFLFGFSAGSVKTPLFEFANNASFTGATTIFNPSIAQTNVGYIRNIDGFFVGNNIVFRQASELDSYGTFATSYATYPFTTGDLFYRIGFNITSVGLTCALSGGNLTIVP